jgi:thioesterase domain-containing protein/acyl carrier protein
VRQAVVIAREDRPGDKRLVGYVTGTADPVELRGQLGDRLPAYMVPAALVALDIMPLTTNGKLDTRSLPAPEYIGAGYRAPTNAVEEILADIYAQVLGLELVGIDDSFFDLGGDSLSAMRLIAMINTNLDADLAVRTLFDVPTVRRLARRLAIHTSATREIVPVQMLREGTGVPLFCIHPAGGVSWPYQVLGDYLDCPIIGIQQARRGEEAEPRSIPEMAANYADRIQEIYPCGPYNLLGWSYGGVVAHEVAIELQRRGGVVARLILLDAQPGPDSRVAAPELISNGNGAEHDAPLTYEKTDELLRELGAIDLTRYEQFFDALVQNLKTNVALYRSHQPGVFYGDMTVLSATRGEDDRGAYLSQSWRPFVFGDVMTHSIDCTHNDMLIAESVSRYAKHLAHLLLHVELELEFASDGWVEARRPDGQLGDERAG